MTEPTTNPMQQQIAAIEAELATIRAAVQPLRDEFDQLRLESRRGDEASTARCEVIDAELTAHSRRSFELALRRTQLLQRVVQPYEWPARRML